MPSKKKSNSLFNMILRNGKGRGGASSSVVQSTPLNSPGNPPNELLVPSRQISDSASISAITPLPNEGRVFSENISLQQQASNDQASCSLPPSCSDRIDIPKSSDRATIPQISAGISYSQTTGNTIDSTPTLYGTNLPFSCEIFRH